MVTSFREITAHCRYLSSGLVAALPERLGEGRRKAAELTLESEVSWPKLPRSPTSVSFRGKCPSCRSWSPPFLQTHFTMRIGQRYLRTATAKLMSRMQATQHVYNAVYRSRPPSLNTELVCSAGLIVVPLKLQLYTLTTRPRRPTQDDRWALVSEWVSGIASHMKKVILATIFTGYIT